MKNCKVVKNKDSDKSPSFFVNKRSLAIERGRRIRMLRALSGLSRQQFQVQLNVAISTLNIWENGRICLTEKGAARIVKAVKALGIGCSSEWLLSGQGQSPSNLKTDHIYSDTYVSDISTSYTVYPEDVNCFLSNYPQSIILKISDDSMTPLYNSGDIVIGLPVDLSDINILLGSHIIVTFGNHTVLRKLEKINNNFCYMSYVKCCNSFAKFHNNDNIQCLSLDKINTVAKILMHRTF